MDNEKYILGIDGGGTSTKACLFDNLGKTIHQVNVGGTNLYTNKEVAIKKICSLVRKISTESEINLDRISAFGFALAGISDKNSRELLLKEFDRLKISSNSIILSDTEAAFNLLCPTGIGILISVGTGIMCMSRNSNGDSYSLAGKGYDKDVGSGYWIGKQVLNNLILNESLITIDSDLNSLYQIVLKKLKINDLESIVSLANEINYVSQIASLTEDIISLAKSGNDLALSIIQEGTRHVGEYILSLNDKMKIYNEEIVIAGNGSVIRNAFYRKNVSQSLEFDYKKIHWVFSDLSPAYSSGILAAACKNINIKIDMIIKNLK